mmetsp:Transcript_33214/g.72469  ORF Transcript_33214/g.72469 Transcript_33214/m.72469 type:complete len:271 (-) Transcript_33214:199-1011(-)
MTPETSRCVEITLDAADIENDAMKLDRGGKPTEAIERYRLAAAGLREASAACGEGHPDRPVLEAHALELEQRIDYLRSLNDAPATVPLEEHIHGVQLSMGDSTSPSALTDSLSSEWTSVSASPMLREGSERKVMGAAAAIGGATGFMLMGPISAAALGVAAAYATTREDKTGLAARKVGRAGVKAAVRAKALDEDFRITRRVAAVSHSALGQAAALDTKYGLTDRARSATVQTQQALGLFNTRHKVVERFNFGIVKAGSTLSGLMTKASR